MGKAFTLHLVAWHCRVILVGSCELCCRKLISKGMAPCRSLFGRQPLRSREAIF